MTIKNTHDTVDRLLKIMQTLRAPEGCPWDAEQTPESLAPYIMEEACELIDAIEEGAPELIMDELGDLLLQVVFLAQIFNERGKFDFHDVATTIADKLIRRHPHVFDQKDPKTCPIKLDKQWDEIKRSEATNVKTCLADHLPVRLPALQRAQKMIAKTYRAERQSELPEAQQILLQQIYSPNDGDDCLQLDENALGQILLHLVSLAHNANLDAETALRKITRATIKQLDSV